ncbi:MarR family winged helix-turn-helix transcriptional regulator [Methylopila sp. M107]|uniref:MarR family winged helix-turn-helix transcriptional regulator n=1 Tax=Methylopila sp. M107 TaxID=1101190 RepID=UPI00035E85CD|nr:MarR family winged helix-turn-helix transcriptional regulator [Methylopila sp. M107]
MFEGQPICYCTALRSATRRITSLYDDALAPAGVGAAQLALLRAIARTTDKASTLTAIGREHGLERSTVGRNVKVLVRMGLIELERDDADLRASAASLTEAGHETLARAEPLWAEMQKKIEDRLGADGAGTLLATLKGL